MDNIKENKIQPLGYIELETGSKAITPMNDFFLNYMFKNSANNESLKSIINIFSEEYQNINKNENHNHKMPYIEGEIEVQTQYQNIITDKILRTQDIKITETTTNNKTFIEFQNTANPRIPIENKSMEYFGLGIGHNKGEAASQIWLLSEPPKKLLQNKPFANYIMKNEDNNPHLNQASITYISLQDISEHNSKAGQLASFLLSKNAEITSDEVKLIANNFNKTFSILKDDKEAQTMMTYKERITLEAEYRGEIRGKIEGKIEDLKEAIHNQDPQRIIDRLKNNLINLGVEEEYIEKVSLEAQEEPNTGIVSS